MKAIKTRIVMDIVLEGEVQLTNLINGKVLKLNQVLVRPIYPAKKSNVIDLPTISNAKH